MVGLTHVKTLDQEVQVSGKLKGDFSLSFTDMTIPIGGIPITITRSYDTLDTGRSGDFGYGWTLGVGDPKLEVDLLPDAGQGWGDSRPFETGTRVYVTLPVSVRQIPFLTRVV